MKRRDARRFWSSIPRASDIKIIRPDGTQEIVKVKGKKSAASVIRKGQR